MIEIIDGCIHENGEYRLNIYGGLKDGIYTMAEVDKYLNELISPLFT